MKITARAETTPNPQTMKFSLGKRWAEESADFKNAKDCARSPLARKLFGFPWCDGVFIGPDFVTVTKQEWVDWDVLTDPLADLIAEHVERGEPVLIQLQTTTSDLNDSPVVQQIKKILNEEIRPAVALDGGDIIFHKYEDQIVYLHMQGACAGCPSSTITLKDGIENRLKNEIPEIREVVSI